MSNKVLGIIFIAVPIISLVILGIRDEYARRLMVALLTFTVLFFMFFIGLDLLGV